MKSFAVKILPWFITIFALYFAFRGVAFGALLDHAKDAYKPLLILAFVITTSSYFIRARRWQYLFIKPTLTFGGSLRVLMLGFFMNNVLPARTGEFVRAHAGAKVSGQGRTLVLATIVSERLIDGLTLSLLFVIFSRHLGDAALSHRLFIVACLFGAVAIGILGMLLLRAPLYKIVNAVHAKVHTRITTYLVTRFTVFLDGLAPLFSPKRLPAIILYSILTWGLELTVYICITNAYHASLTTSECVLFLTAVNFSSLIPAAPGGVGVIELATTAALTSIGVDKSQALAMVLTQHLIQYVVVGIGGGIAMATWKGNLRAIQTEAETDAELSSGTAS